jgi:hypothetical protein
LRKTFEMMEGFSFVTPVTGLNRPNTGKEEDDDDDDDDDKCLTMTHAHFVSTSEV